MSNSAPVIDWPTTLQGWCEWYRRLDAKYGTDKRSPLHHDNKCSIPGHRTH